MQTSFGRIIKYRELVYALIKKEVSIRYRQSLLGVFWVILPQIVTVIITLVLAKYRIIAEHSGGIPYTIYVVWSVSLWQLFSAILSATTNSLVSAGPLVTKIGFPKEAILFSCVATPCLDFVIRLIPFFIILYVYDFYISYLMIFNLIIVVLVVAMAIGIGFFTSMLNLVIRDVSNLVGMALTFGLFLSPILYYPSDSYPLKLFNFMNPFSPLLIASQDFLIGRLPQIHAVAIVSGLFSVLVFFIGWKVFILTIPRVIERA